MPNVGVCNLAAKLCGTKKKECEAFSRAILGSEQVRVLTH